MKTITIKKNSKMKTIKLNKNGKARQPRKANKSTSAKLIFAKIDVILEKVEDMCEYAKRNLCNESFQFEELEEMLWKLANRR